MAADLARGAMLHRLADLAAAGAATSDGTKVPAGGPTAAGGPTPAVAPGPAGASTSPGAGTPPGAGSPWRPVDDDLAVLVYDSKFDPELLVGVRSSGIAHRQLTFEGRHLLLELDVVEGLVAQVTCQVVPAQKARLTVRHRAGTVDLGEDRFGLFYCKGLPEGPVSLLCEPLEGRFEPVATSWLSL